MATANTTLKQIGDYLEAAQSVLLFPHINPDPDALGSSIALCRILRKLGKKAWVLMDGPQPEYMQFMFSMNDKADSENVETEDPGCDPDGVLVTLNKNVMETPDICMMADCSEDKRIVDRIDAFFAGKTTLCLDHHQVQECGYDHYYIDPGAAATAQLVFRLAREMDWQIDLKIANLLYAGICGDTGCFMHSNTTPEVHRIAAELQECGVDINPINVNLYQSRDLKTVMLSAKAMKDMDLFADGRAVMSKLTAEDFRSFDAKVEHADLIIDDLRCINGVEIAALLKEDDGKIRVNLRSKNDADVSAIAIKFGGGGHIKASGFKSERPLDEVYKDLREEILRVLG